MLVLFAGVLYGSVRRSASDERIANCEKALSILNELQKQVVSERRPLPEIMNSLEREYGIEPSNEGAPLEFSESMGEAGALLDKAVKLLSRGSEEVARRALGETEADLRELYEREKNELAPKAALISRLSVMAGAAAAILIL